VRRAAPIVALFLGLGVWMAAAVAMTDRSPARAQTPPVTIDRVQDAGFVPARRGDDPLVVLAIGSDARAGEEVTERLADSIHLITVHPDLEGATILGFPRDSYVEIPGHGTHRINEALNRGGPDLLVETVQKLTGIQVDYYFLTAFTGMTKIINAIGGIEVDIPYPMNDSDSGAVFEAGPQELDGQEALAFSRNRKNTPDGDFSRSENQGLVLLGALEKFHREYRSDPVTLFRWVTIGMGTLLSNLTLEEALELAVTALEVRPQDVTNLVVPGTTAMAGDASVVFIAEEAEAIYEDLRDDGLLNR
jgi:polyisoprenyl-teichoic acid--peptidoglycan teichoic acid transferase